VKSKIYDIPTEELQKIINDSNTISQVLDAVGLKNKGSNYKTLDRRCIQEGIDLDKLRQRSKEYLKLNSFTILNKISLENILVENSSYNRTHLKKRLLSGNVLDNICSICKLKPEWNGESLTLVLDHINGTPNDNRLENLRLVCPNCNSQLPTFAGRSSRVFKDKKDINDRKSPRPLKDGPPTGECPICFNNVYKTKFCSPECAAKDKRKVDRPSKEQLIQEIESFSWVALGKKYGVSDNAVKKWAKSYGLV